ncbi:MAG: F0F1 ATP synthase subunit delta [Sulfurospirillaceae bacterium]|nr:F0F1 ATP synthase subunit delta [Sulfurospirillaceae bacterium]MDD3463697.1 F0F1 ATP synthase subunit delta [Sulfurospirillaceae bacterium]
MSSSIAKKYVNALVKSCDQDEVVSIYASLGKIVVAFESDKFNTIVLSPDIDSKSKENFVLSLTEEGGSKFVNFIKLLNHNDRLNEIPNIVKELKYQISLKNNSFEGEIVSNFKLEKEQIAILEQNFSKKFNAQIKLNNKITDYPGIKINLDDLGVEVSFSLDRLKTQMSEHILRAI